MRDMLNFIWQSELRDRCRQSENMKLLLREVSLRSKRPLRRENKYFESASQRTVHYGDNLLYLFLFFSDLHLSFRSDHPNSESWPD